MRLDALSGRSAIQRLPLRFAALPQGRVFEQDRAQSLDIQAQGRGPRLL